MSVDSEDELRRLRGELAWVDTLHASDQFRYFLHLVDRKIEQRRTALEKGGDEITMNTIVGELKALRSVAGILTDERTKVTNQIRNQGAST